MDRFSCLPLKKFWRSCWIFGIRVEPPTKTTSWICPLSNLASFRAFSTGSNVERNKSEHSSSNRALLILVSPQSADRSRIGSEVFLVFPLEFFGKVVDQPVVKVFTAQVCVSSGRLYFKQRAFIDGQDRYIKRATTQIEDKDVLLTFQILVKTVGQGGGCRFVDNPEHIQSSYGTGIFGSLSLGIVEVSRNSDHSVLHCGTQVGLSDFFHLGEHHGADLLGSEGLHLSFELHLDLRFATIIDNFEGPMFDILLDLRIVVLTADESFGIENCITGVHSHLVLGGISDKPLGVREGDVTWCCPVALVVGDDFHFPVLPDANTGIGGAQCIIYMRLDPALDLLTMSASSDKSVWPGCEGGGKLH
nr:unnamed protein product [Callosobruchus chinensis]